MGTFSVGNPTLSRFFALHFILPFVILAGVVIHILLLHESGSSNKLGLDSYNNIPFSNYFYKKDLLFTTIVLFFFIILMYFYPNMLGHSTNYILGNSQVTPTHIVPEWYFLPFYAILKSFESKAYGVIAMVASLLLLLFMPFLVKIPYSITGSRSLFIKL